jgi:hypothetical protein
VKLITGGFKMKFGIAVMSLGLAAFLACAPIAQAQNIITDTVKGAADIAGGALRATGAAAKLTVDAAGNIVDVAGNTVKLTRDTTGYLLDPVSGTLRGTVLRTGRALDLTGKALVSGTGLLVIQPATGAVIGTLGTTCNLVSLVDAGVAKRQRDAMTAFIVDPATGGVTGVLSPAGAVIDLAGKTITDATFKGYTVINPSTRVVVGTIDDAGKLVALNLTNPTFGTVANPVAFVVDPLTGTLRGALDATGAIIDTSGTAIAAPIPAGLVLVDATTRGLHGVIDASGKVVNTVLSLPGPTSITTRPGVSK